MISAVSRHLKGNIWLERKLFIFCAIIKFLPDNVFGKDLANVYQNTNNTNNKGNNVIQTMG